MTESERESITRGFLFADLRGYTDFVESHGAAAAASLLTRYRSLARESIGRFGGAEIKTEGDRFYVVFGSVSGAVRCGLALVAEAAAAGSPARFPPAGVSRSFTLREHASGQRACGQLEMRVSRHAPLIRVLMRVLQSPINRRSPGPARGASQQGLFGTPYRIRVLAPPDCARACYHAALNS